MTALDQVRAVALLLPETVEQPTADGANFLVAGEVFARVAAGAATVLRIREPAGEVAITLGADADWPLVEDRIARSWELTAPRRLLEAGGR